MPHTPRIVSLAPALTELCLAFDCGAQLVGVSDYCALPQNQAVVRLGGPGNPDLQQLHALHPDIVLLDQSPGAPYHCPAIPAQYTTISLKIRTIEGMLEQVRELARELGVETGHTLHGRLRAALDQAYASQPGRRLRRTVLFTWADPWVAVGGDTYGDDMLRVCMAENIAMRLPGHAPRASLERFMRYNPQVILLAGDESLLDTARAACWRYGDVAAILQGRIHLIDRSVLDSYVHMPEALLLLMQCIHQPDRPN